QQQRRGQAIKLQSGGEGGRFPVPHAMAARQRSPRGAHPLRRAILVEAPVSSMKINLFGSRSSWPSNQAWRSAVTSGSCCSAACAVFFVRDPVALEKA
ncbi:MAG: hypothetical protein ACFCUQ_10065, partial [Kiloniellales bacterium]